MSKPTREELLEALKASHAREQRDPAERAGGLDALLAATDALPTAEPVAPVAPKTGSWLRRLVVALAALVLVVVLWRVQTTPVASVVVDAGQSVAPPDAGPAVPLEVPPPPPPVPVAPPPMAPDAPDAAVTPPPRVKPKPAAITGEVEDPDTLAREVALLERARRALAEAPGATLTTLEQYDREFPTGVMRTEATLVRVEALVKLERRVEAEKLSRALMNSDRDGLVRRRLAKLLDAGVP